MFSENYLDMIDIVVQVLCLLSEEWLLLMYMLGE